MACPPRGMVLLLFFIQAAPALALAGPWFLQPNVLTGFFHPPQANAGAKPGVFQFPMEIHTNQRRPKDFKEPSRPEPPADARDEDREAEEPRMISQKPPSDAASLFASSGAIAELDASSEAASRAGSEFTAGSELEAASGAEAETQAETQVETQAETQAKTQAETQASLQAEMLAKMQSDIQAAQLSKLKQKLEAETEAANEKLHKSKAALHDINRKLKQRDMTQDASKDAAQAKMPAFKHIHATLQARDAAKGAKLHAMLGKNMYTVIHYGNENCTEKSDDARDVFKASDRQSGCFNIVEGPVNGTSFMVRCRKDSEIRQQIHAGFDCRGKKVRNKRMRHEFFQGSCSNKQRVTPALSSYSESFCAKRVDTESEEEGDEVVAPIEEKKKAKVSVLASKHKASIAKEKAEAEEKTTYEARANLTSYKLHKYSGGKGCKSTTDKELIRVFQAADTPGCYNVLKGKGEGSSFKLRCLMKTHAKVFRQINYVLFDCKGETPSKKINTSLNLIQGMCHLQMQMSPPLQPEDYPACVKDMAYLAPVAAKPASSSPKEDSEGAAPESKQMDLNPSEESEAISFYSDASEEYSEEADEEEIEEEVEEKATKKAAKKAAKKATKKAAKKAAKKAEAVEKKAEKKAEEQAADIVEKVKESSTEEQEENATTKYMVQEYDAPGCASAGKVSRIFTVSNTTRGCFNEVGAKLKGASFMMRCQRGKNLHINQVVYSKPDCKGSMSSRKRMLHSELILGSCFQQRRITPAFKPSDYPVCMKELLQTGAEDAGEDRNGTQDGNEDGNSTQGENSTSTGDDATKLVLSSLSKKTKKLVQFATSEEKDTVAPEADFEAEVDHDMETDETGDLPYLSGGAAKADSDEVLEAKLNDEIAKLDSIEDASPDAAPSDAKAE